MDNRGHYYELFGPDLTNVGAVFVFSTQSQTCSQWLSDPAEVALVADPVCNIYGKALKVWLGREECPA